MRIFRGRIFRRVLLVFCIFNLLSSSGVEEGVSLRFFLYVVYVELTGEWSSYIVPTYPLEHFAFESLGLVGYWGIMSIRKGLMK